jgi:glycosyltransferase involved in cell wall biosynthesis
MLLKVDELQAWDKLLRLLHVVPTYLPALRYGGPIRSVHALCRELAARGHEVHVFTTNVDGPGDSDVLLGQPVDLDGVQVTYFPSRLLRRLYWSPPMARALAAQTASFDLVHVHAIYLWPTLAGARAARKHNLPYVLSPRGMLVPELIRRRSRWVKQAWIALIERHNLEAASAIHTTSTVEAEHLRSFGWS